MRKPYDALLIWSLLLSSHHNINHRNVWPETFEHFNQQGTSFQGEPGERKKKGVYIPFSYMEWQHFSSNQIDFRSYLPEKSWTGTICAIITSKNIYYNFFGEGEKIGASKALFLSFHICLLTKDVLNVLQSD